jgi:type II secretory pathway pseudopilin PulG
MKISFHKGMSIVEIVVAAGIIATSVLGIVGAIQVYLKIVYSNTRETQAVLLLDETAEALQYLRDTSYSANFASTTASTTYTLYWNGTGYQLATSTISLPYGMSRTISFDSVRRDGSDQIVSSGGTLDPNTKKVTINIAWPYKNATTTISSEMLIHNIYAN